MGEPIVLISHHRLVEGDLDELRAMSAANNALLLATKPATLSSLVYYRAEEREVSVIHVFTDADAFDAHLEGVMERASRARQFFSPIGYEIDGRPSPGGKHPDGTVHGEWRLPAPPRGAGRWLPAPGRERRSRARPLGRASLADPLQRGQDASLRRLPPQQLHGAKERR